MFYENEYRIKSSGDIDKELISWKNGSPSLITSHIYVIYHYIPIVKQQIRIR